MPRCRIGGRARILTALSTKITSDNSLSGKSSGRTIQPAVFAQSFICRGGLAMMRPHLALHGAPLQSMDFSSGIRKRVIRAWQRHRAPKIDATAAILRSIGHPDERTIDMLRERTRKDPRNAAALARALKELGREPEAQNVLDAALDRRPGDRLISAEATRLLRHRWAPVKQGLALLRGKEPGAAKEVFIDALATIGSQCPVDALFDILCGIGWCDQELSLAESSLAVFERAARLKPDRLDAAFGAGLSLRLLGQEQEARIRLARASHIEKTASGPIAFIGWCHHEASRGGPARRAFQAALKKNKNDPEAAWGLAWTIWTDDSPSEAARAFQHAIRCGLHTSVAQLIPLVPIHSALAGVGSALAAALLEAGRLLEAETIASDPSLMIRILVADDRHEEALLHSGARSITCGLALRALVKAALALGRWDEALNIAMRLEGSERTRVMADVHCASGRHQEALTVRRAEAAATLPETAAEIERLRRAIEREGLRNFDTGLLPEGGPTRTLALRYSARKLMATGDHEAVRSLLAADPECAELLEELLPTASNQTPRGYLAAVLAGFEPKGTAPTGVVGMASKMLLQPNTPNPRNMRKLRRLIYRNPEDNLLVQALRELIQKETTA